MQFYASFALHPEQPRHPSSVSIPALDIKSSAFSTPEEEEGGGNLCCEGSVKDQFTSPTVPVLHGLRQCWDRADADAELS